MTREHPLLCGYVLCAVTMLVVLRVVELVRWLATGGWPW